MNTNLLDLNINIFTFFSCGIFFKYYLINFLSFSIRTRFGLPDLSWILSFIQIRIDGFPCVCVCVKKMSILTNNLTNVFDMSELRNAQEFFTFINK